MSEIATVTSPNRICSFVLSTTVSVEVRLLRWVNNPRIVHQHLDISSLRGVVDGDAKVTYQVEKTPDSVEVEG